MDARDFARQVTGPPSVAGVFPQSGTEYQPPVNKLRTADTPSNAPSSATTRIATDNSVSMKRDDLPREKSVISIQPVNVDSRSKTIWNYDSKHNYELKRDDLPREKIVISIQPVNVDSRSKKIWNYDSKHNYAHGQADLRKSAPALASKSGNTRIAPISLVKDTLPNEAQKPSASKQKLLPKVCLFKKKKVNKVVGIYADWSDEESSVP